MLKYFIDRYVLSGKTGALVQNFPVVNVNFSVLKSYHPTSQQPWINFYRSY